MFIAVAALLGLIVGGLGGYWFGFISMVVTIPIGVLIGVICGNLQFKYRG